MNQDLSFRTRLEINRITTRFMAQGEKIKPDTLSEIQLELWMRSLELGNEEVRELSTTNTQNKIDLVSLLMESLSLRELLSNVIIGPHRAGYSHCELFARLYEHSARTLFDLLERVDRASQLRIAIVGCGFGNDMLSLARSLKSRGLLGAVHFAGYDISESALATARKLVEGRCPELSVEFVQADVADGRFGDRLRSFRPDVTICHHLIEHLPGPLDNRVLQDLLHATRHRVCVSVPLEDWLVESISNHLHEFTIAQVERLGHAMEVRCAGAVKCVALELTSPVGLIDWEREAVSAFGTRHVVIQPEGVQVPQDPRFSIFDKLFDPSELSRKRHTAVKIGELADKKTFVQEALWPRQVRALPIKFPGSEMFLPIEFENCAEAIRMIASHNISINPDYEKSFVYLNVFRGEMSVVDQRQGGLSLHPHGDQLQNLRGELPYKPDYSYIGSSTLPTIFFDQDFDVTEVIEAARRGLAVDLYDELEKQLREEGRYYSENYCFFLLSPYVIHSAQPAINRDGEFRIFLKVAISLKRVFDNRELRMNHALDYHHWFAHRTVGYSDRFLNHAHWNERFLLCDLAE